MKFKKKVRKIRVPLLVGSILFLLSVGIAYSQLVLSYGKLKSVQLEKDTQNDIYKDIYKNTSKDFTAVIKYDSVAVAAIVEGN